MEGIVWYLVRLLTLMATTSGLKIEKYKCDYNGDISRAPLRLADTKEHNVTGISGRLEICYNKFWMTVCRTRDSIVHNEPNSEVACYQLNFGGSAKEDPWQSCHDDDTCGLYEQCNLLSNVNCKGSEKYFGLCPNESSSDDKSIVNCFTCLPARRVVLTCSNLLQVKLVYLSENDDLGWVKHYYNGTWGQLCLVGEPAQQEVDKIGNVVCRQMGLGYSDNSTIATIRESQHNLVTNVKCNGNETALRLCSSTIWETTLDTACIGQAVWVDCVGPKPDNFHVVSTDIYTATLSWTVPKETLYYPVIKSYSIWYKSDTSGNKMFIYYASNNDTVTARVLDLQPDTWYTFKVKANFPIKSGPYSIEVHAKTGPPLLEILAAFFGTLSLLFGSCCCLLLCCVYRPKCGRCWYRRFENGRRKTFFRCPFERRDSPCPRDPFECCKCYDANFRERKDRRERMLNGGYVQIEGHVCDGGED